MNVIVANRYRDALASLDIEVIKKLEGEYTASEIVETFKNVYFNKMILDVTALKDYKNIKTIQNLSLSLDMERVVLLLDGSPETSAPEYLSDLISMHIYNFTFNIEGVKYLYEHPNSYRDVAQYHQLDTNHEVSYVSEPRVSSAGGGTTVISFNNVTNMAGSTTLTYIAKKQLSRNYNVVAIEVNKHDFIYFDEKDMYSVASSDLGNSIVKYGKNADIILIDANNNSSAESLSNISIYLIEPSKIQINKLLTKSPDAFNRCRGKKVVLNKCLLSQQDISDFSYETKVDVFYSLPPLDDQSSNNAALDEFFVKLGFHKQETNISQKVNSKKGFLGLFR